MAIQCGSDGPKILNGAITDALGLNTLIPALTFGGDTPTDIICCDLNLDQSSNEIIIITDNNGIKKLWAFTFDGINQLFIDVVIGSGSVVYLGCCDLNPSSANEILVVLNNNGQNQLYVFNSNGTSAFTPSQPQSVGVTGDTFIDIVCCELNNVAIGVEILALLRDQNSALKLVGLTSTGTYQPLNCNNQDCTIKLAYFDNADQNKLNELATLLKSNCEQPLAGIGGGLCCDCESIAPILLSKLPIDTVENKIKMLVTALVKIQCSCDEIVHALMKVSGLFTTETVQAKANILAQALWATCGCDGIASSFSNVMIGNPSSNPFGTGLALATIIAIALKSITQNACPCDAIASALLNVTSTNLFPSNTTPQEKANVIAQALKNAGCSCNEIAQALALLNKNNNNLLGIGQTLANAIAKALSLTGCSCLDVAQALANVQTNEASQDFNVNQVIIALTTIGCSCEQIKSALGKIAFILGVNIDEGQLDITIDGDELIYCCESKNAQGQKEHYLVIIETDNTSDETKGAYEIFVLNNNGALQTSISPNPLAGLINVNNFDLNKNPIMFCCYRKLAFVNTLGSYEILDFQNGSISSTTGTIILSSTQTPVEFVCCSNGEAPIFILQDSESGLFSFSGTNCTFSSKCHNFVSTFCCNEEVFVLLKAYDDYFLYVFDNKSFVQKTVSFKNITCNNYLVFANSVSTLSTDANYILVLDDEGDLISCCENTYATGHVVEVIECCVLGCENDGKNEIFILSRDAHHQLWLFAFNYKGSFLPRFGFPVGSEGDEIITTLCCLTPPDSAPQYVMFVLKSVNDQYKFLVYNNKGESLTLDCNHPCFPTKEWFSSYEEYYHFLLSTNCACKGDTTHIIQIALEHKCDCVKKLAYIQDLFITVGQAKFNEAAHTLKSSECTCEDIAKALRSIFNSTDIEIAISLKEANCCCHEISKTLNLNASDIAQILKNSGCSCAEILNILDSLEISEKVQILKHIGCSCSEISELIKDDSSVVQILCCDFNGDCEDDGVLILKENTQHIMNIISNNKIHCHLLLGEAGDTWIGAFCCDLNSDGVNEVLILLKDKTDTFKVLIVDHKGKMSWICKIHTFPCFENTVFVLERQNEVKFFVLTNQNELTFCPKELRCNPEHCLENVLCCGNRIILVFKHQDDVMMYLIDINTGAVVSKKHLHKYLNLFCCDGDIYFVNTCYKISIYDQEGKEKNITDIQYETCDFNCDDHQETIVSYLIDGEVKLLALNKNGESVWCPICVDKGDLLKLICCSLKNKDKNILLALKINSKIYVYTFDKNGAPLIVKKEIGSDNNQLINLACCDCKINVVLKDGEKYILYLMNISDSSLEVHTLKLFVCDADKYGCDNYIFYYIFNNQYYFFATQKDGDLVFCPTKLGLAYDTILDTFCCKHHFVVITKNVTGYNKLYVLNDKGSFLVNGLMIGQDDEKYLSSICCDLNNDGINEILISVKNHHNVYYLYAFTHHGERIYLYDFRARPCDMDNNNKDEILMTFLIGQQHKIVSIKKDGTFLHCPQDTHKKRKL